MFRASTLSGSGSSTASNSISFGTGFDGDVTISSGTTSLVRDMYYNNLTMNGTGRIINGGFRIFIAGTLDITNAVSSSIATLLAGGGSGAAGGTGGTAVSIPSGTIVSGTNASNGAAGTTTAGATSSNASFGNTGGGSLASGSGGAGSGGAGGNGRGPIATSGLNPIYGYRQDLLRGATLITGGSGGSGAGGGGGDSVNSGAGGGAGGAGGGITYIAANIINRGPSTATSCINALGNPGGAGGSPATGNCGGGGGGAGGGGGFIIIYYNQLIGSVATNALAVTAAAGGNGGNGIGTGIGGAGGASGDGGRVILYNLSTDVATQYTGVAGTLGGAASGVTAGTGALASFSRTDL